MWSAGCVHDKDGFATLQGPRDSFPAPEYQIKGETPYDQKWADETTEAGVAGLGWKRPKPRPASLSKPKVTAPSPKKTFKQRWLYFHFRERAVQ